MGDDSVFKFIAAPQGFLHALPIKPAILLQFDGFNPNLTGLFAPVSSPVRIRGLKNPSNFIASN
jgi:hypothetical protein